MKFHFNRDDVSRVNILMNSWCVNSNQIIMNWVQTWRLIKSWELSSSSQSSLSHPKSTKQINRKLFRRNSVIYADIKPRPVSIRSKISQGKTHTQFQTQTVFFIIVSSLYHRVPCLWSLRDVLRDYVLCRYFPFSLVCENFTSVVFRKSRRKWNLTVVQCFIALVRVFCATFGEKETTWVISSSQYSLMNWNAFSPSLFIMNSQISFSRNHWLVPYGNPIVKSRVMRTHSPLCEPRSLKNVSKTVINENFFVCTLDWSSAGGRPKKTLNNSSKGFKRLILVGKSTF